jgi:glycosidase
MRFWLDRGVDGFRMDVINFISKEPGLPDAPVTDPSSAWQSAISLHSAGPRLHEFLRGIGSLLEEYDACSVGEMPGVSDPEEVLKSVGQERGELNMIFHFELYVSLSPPRLLPLPSLPFLPLSSPHPRSNQLTTTTTTPSPSLA